MPLSGQQIYENFQQGRGGAGLGETAGILRDLAGNYTSRADRLGTLTGALDTAWTGKAAGAAGGSAAPIAKEFARTAPDLATMQDLVQRQVSSFDSAKSSVCPVPPAPHKPGLWDNLSGLVGDTFEAKQAAHNNAAQHNVDVMNNYALATEHHANGMPSSVGATATADSGTGVSSAAIAGNAMTGAPAAALGTATGAGSFSGVLPIGGEASGAGLAGTAPIGSVPASRAGTVGGGGGGIAAAAKPGSTRSDDDPSIPGPAGGTVGGVRSAGEDQLWSSFLVDNDADAVFGTDESTAPPVIGE
ncbi:PPE family protein [Tamaricihabitans halophyticus]|uniref:PPE family protein n=1 Tax=Tamaricihabitans halophyticus TaxID=1262583 RepID=A0A4R2R4E8_9PSEU|nr:hypothetical protein [Tamaricihabitans halophyticus]TCP56877.1 PPE family protein [Tamaricihabitans halophyticus]